MFAGLPNHSPLLTKLTKENETNLFIYLFIRFYAGTLTILRLNMLLISSQTYFIVKYSFFVREVERGGGGGWEHGDLVVPALLVKPFGPELWSRSWSCFLGQDS